MRRMLLLWVLLFVTSCATLPADPVAPMSTPDPLIPTSTTVIAVDTPQPTPSIDVTTPTSAAQVIPGGGELLALSNGDLIGVSIATQNRRIILSGVSDFAAAPNGLLIAAIRGIGANGELWTVNRDATEVQQRTDDQRTLADIAWLPDSSGIVYAASDTDSKGQASWLDWAAFCRNSTIIKRLWADPREIPMAPGCDPTVSPDGKRIAYATRPSRTDSSAADPAFTAANTIHLINVAGQNGWDPISAAGAEPGRPGQGLLVYHPSWSRDGKSLFVSVFLGNRVETDVNLLTLVDASAGTQQLLGTSAGWNRALIPAPDGGVYLLTSQNTGNARGALGWDTWQSLIMNLTGTRDIYLPDGTFSATGTPLGDTLNRAQFAAWQPDGKALAVLMPPAWDPGIAPNEDYGHVDEAGELWIWQVGGIPTKKISTPIDAGSPIQWLP